MMYMFLSGLILCLVGTLQPGLLDVAINEVPVETDDDRLNQALLLVDILKSEYLKLLREHSGGVVTDAVTVEQMEQSTCATTAGEGSTDNSFPSTEKQKTEMLIINPKPNTLAEIPRGHPNYPVLVYTAAPPNPWGWPVPATPARSRRFYDIMPEPEPPIYPNMLSYPRRYFRRNFPEYPYYYGLYRRSGNYDENPGETARELKTSTITITKTAASTRKATRKTSQIFGSRRRFNTQLRRSNNYRNYQNPRRSGVMEGSNKTSDIGNNKTKTILADKSIVNASSSIITGKSIPANGTSVNNTDASDTAKSNKSKLHHTIKPNVPSTSATIDKWPAFLFKSTLRVFLENSTPLPIPLPENNAFCFTNPHNALCRSP